MPPEHLALVSVPGIQPGSWHGKVRETDLPSTQSPVCLPVAAKSHLACNCVHILDHSKVGFVGIKFRLLEGYCPGVRAGRPGVLH